MTTATEKEMHLLSVAMLSVENTATAAAAGVTAEVFDSATHRSIWTAITRTASTDGSTHADVVYRALSGIDGSGQNETTRRLFEISGLEPTSLRLQALIADVLALHRRRKLLAALAAATDAAQANCDSWGDLWDHVAPHLLDAQESGADTRHRSLEDIAATAISWRQQPDSRPKIPTPWPGWDRIATEPKAGELIVIAGRPGTGKTTLAGNIADDLARSGRHVAVFSLEMGAEELADRFAVRRAGRNGIGNDKFANAAVAAQLAAIGKMKTLRIFEADEAPSVARIEAHCRLLAAAPQRLGAVVVDYLQLVQPPTDAKREPREQQVAAMSRRFKLLARAIDCPVFLLAQLNRESEKEERRPRLSDLRESGSIEQDADRVWFLYRPKPDASNIAPAEDASEIDVALYQAKCRNGPQGIEAVMRFNRPLFDFRAA